MGNTTPTQTQDPAQQAAAPTIGTATLGANTLTPAQLKEIADGWNKVSEKNKLVNEQNELGTSLLQKYTEQWDDLKKKIGNGFVSALGNNAGPEIKKVADTIIGGMQIAKTAISTNDLFAGNIDRADDGFAKLNTKMSSMGEEWKKMGNAMPNFLKEFGGNAIDNASKAQAAQMNLVKTMASGGNLSEIFGSKGELLENLSLKTLRYTDNLSNVAKANNQTLSSTISYASALGKLPGLMQESINTNNSSSGSYDLLSSAMKVAAGSGKSMSEVISVINTSYDDLSNANGKVVDSGQKALTLFSTMSTLSNNLGISFNQTEGFLLGVSNQFKLVGDNTEAAAKILSKFTDSLRNTGLTTGGSIEIIRGMVKAMGELQMGTKSFISAQSGGVGGLQGALQIEQLMRKGKTDEVMNMVQSALKKQMGGRIYTQEEGAQSQEAAAGFFRQRELLKSNAFGNLAQGSDEKATRLLEAMSKGDVGKFVVTGQDALRQVTQQGNTIQSEGNSLLTQISVNSELQTLSTQVSALNLIKIAAKNDNTSKMLSDDRNKSSEMAMLSMKNITSSSRKENTSEDFILQRNKEFMSSLGNGIGSAASGLANSITDKFKNRSAEQNTNEEDLKKLLSNQKNTEQKPKITQETLTENSKAQENISRNTALNIANRNENKNQQVTVVVKVDDAAASRGITIETTKTDVPNQVGGSAPQ